MYEYNVFIAKYVYIDRYTQTTKHFINNNATITSKTDQVQTFVGFEQNDRHSMTVIKLDRICYTLRSHYIINERSVMADGL